MKRFLKILILVLVFVGAIWIIFFKFLKVSKINCESQYGICDSNLELIISALQNKKENIFEARNDLEKILKYNKNVLDYSIRFNPLFGLKAFVIEKKAVAAFVTGNIFTLVDSDGEILGKTNSTALPKIDSSINLSSDEISYLAKLMSGLYNFFGVTTGKVTADGLTVTNLKGKTVIFPLTGNIDVLLGSLTLIFSRLPSVSQASTILTIDLRFKNPVLR